jgi:uncharacterized Zn finger protein
VIPKLSEASIWHQTIAQSFERGEVYYRNGAVTSLIQRGTVLSGKVEGSEAEPYCTRIHFDRDQISTATCTCSYEWEGWCKHIVATLLACLHEPDLIERGVELSERLAPLNRQQLQTIVQNLANDRPEWLDEIEQQIEQVTQQSAIKSKKAPAKTTVDPKQIERQIKRIFDRYPNEWDYPGLGELQELIAKANPFLKRGDGNNALVILGAIARSYVQDWLELDGASDESDEFCEELDQALTQAILCAQLSDSDRQRWQKDLENWQTEVDAYGIDSFNMSLVALAQGRSIRIDET